MPICPLLLLLLAAAAVGMKQRPLSIGMDLDADQVILLSKLSTLRLMPGPLVADLGHRPWSVANQRPLQHPS